MNRIFHQRFTLTSKCAISLFTLLAFYFLWNKMAIPALLVVIVIVMMIERVLHTTYTLLLDEDEVQRLVIYLYNMVHVILLVYNPTTKNFLWLS